MAATRGASAVGLPPRPFLYAVDQIATLLGVNESTVRTDYLFFQGRSVGPRDRRRMLAVNITPDQDAKPEWRVAENELVRWMRMMGIRIHERTWAR